VNRDILGLFRSVEVRYRQYWEGIASLIDRIGSLLQRIEIGAGVLEMCCWAGWVTETLE